MKSLTKVMLASALVAAPIVGAVGTASANTELVPAARLVVPYWDQSGSRSTLLMLTNVSRTIDLRGSSQTGSEGEVHIEWYDKSCNRADIAVQLSPEDIDQIDLSDASTNLPAGTQGYADIDVRDAASNTGTSIQYNVLLGTVVIADIGSDFAISYPAASSIGSSDRGTGTGQTATGVGGNIVTRNSDGSGDALVWTGTYEPFPSRVFVPMYFAEEGPLYTGSLLAIAAPANGNWADGALGEAPGQKVFSDDAIDSTLLISANTQVFDGCENRVSKAISGHYIIGSLGSLFGTTIMDQANWNVQTGFDCGGSSNYPSTDEAGDAFVGWIDVPNAMDIGPASSVKGDQGDETDRGLVGVLVEWSDVSSPISASGQQGDVTRLWGDPYAGGRGGFYSNVDGVSHSELVN